MAIGERARRIMEGRNFAFIATVNPDGSPHVTPVWVDTDGEHVLINTAKGRIKYRNVIRDPRVSVAVVDWANPYDSVVVKGAVERMVEGDEAERHIDRLAKKYLGLDSYPYREAGERRVILVIRPERVAEG